MSNLYLVNGRVSETPIYWTARYSHGVVNQIDESGKISKKWSELPLDDLEYWGIISNMGTYGFYPKENICDMNGTKLRFEPTPYGKLSYNRTILSSSDGWISTKCVKIGFFGYIIKLTLLPELNIVFTTDEEITGNKIKDLEL